MYQNNGNILLAKLLLHLSLFVLKFMATKEYKRNIRGGGYYLALFNSELMKLEYSVYIPFEERYSIPKFCNSPGILPFLTKILIFGSLFNSPTLSHQSLYGLAILKPFT